MREKQSQQPESDHDQQQVDLGDGVSIQSLILDTDLPGEPSNEGMLQQPVTEPAEDAEHELLVTETARDIHLPGDNAEEYTQGPQEAWQDIEGRRLAKRQHVLGSLQFHTSRQ